MNFFLLIENKKKKKKKKKKIVGGGRGAGVSDFFFSMNPNFYSILSHNLGRLSGHHR